MSEWLQVLIIAVIMLGIGVAIWRGGSANPTGTGHIGRAVGRLDAHVGRLDLRVGHLEEEVDELTKSAATTKDIDALRREVTAMLDGQAQMMKATKDSVSRIELMLIEKGMGK